MKRKYIVMSSFFVAFFALSLMCYGSWLYAGKMAEKEERRDTGRINAEQTGGGVEQKVTYDTRYVLETCHEDTGETTRQQLTIPSEYTGMTRTELEDYLGKCEEAMRSEEQEAGLSRIQLLSFSSEEIVVRKTYRKPEQETGFFLTVADGEVAIYNRSGTKLYEKTGIRVAGLPEDERKKLKEGFVVENEKDLYSILENFSS